LLALRRASVDLAGATVSIAARLTHVGYEMADRPGTKMAAGSRVVDLDPQTVYGLSALKRGGVSADR
jgi:hypothetical protein